MNWYAIFVESGKEEIVQKYLSMYFDADILYSMVPRRVVPERRKGKIYHVMKTLFPGYVLIKTRMNGNMLHKMRSIPDFYRFVNNGSCYTKEAGEYYCQIREEEMSVLFKLIEKGDIISYSKIKIEESKVYVVSGPLHGLEGTIKKIDKRKKRAKVQLNLLGKEQTVELGIELSVNDSVRS
ncbi:antiterminator LoaP [Bacillus vallismortis]|uniref:Transcription termination/antitermination protein NusG n=1 Tax=Bacillus vallismortis TaxID=72361 RepID=A0ABY4Y1F1_BACVA|nr:MULTISPECIES: antiterminator LoaP [Bacillus subtilis group]USP96454.1 antiterminator LoaP [Bacillus vallismortis]